MGISVQAESVRANNLRTQFAGCLKAAFFSIHLSRFPSKQRRFAVSQLFNNKSKEISTMAVSFTSHSCRLIVGCILLAMFLLYGSGALASEIVVVIDTSGSMGQPINPTNSTIRINAVQDALREFFRQVPTNSGV